MMMPPGSTAEDYCFLHSSLFLRTLTPNKFKQQVAVKGELTIAEISSATAMTDRQCLQTFFGVR